MAYLESIYTGLKILREAAAVRNEVSGTDEDLTISAGAGFIVVQGIVPDDLTATQKRKLDMGGWVHELYQSGVVLEGETPPVFISKWKRSC